MSEKAEQKDPIGIDTTNMPVFPKIKISRDKNTLQMETLLRKKHRGVWYIWPFNRRAYVPEDRNDFSSAVSSFTRDIYMAMLYGKISVNTKGIGGERYFQRDRNQIDEKLRMKPLDWTKN